MSSCSANGSTPGDWVLVLCGALGVGFILFFEAQGEQLSGVVFGLVSGVTFAGVVLCVRQLRGVDAAWLITLEPGGHRRVAVARGRRPWHLADRQAVRLSHCVWHAAAGLALLPVCTRRARRSPATKRPGIALLEPILVPVWVFLAWHAEPTYQPPRWWTYVGGSLILAGLLWRYAWLAVATHCSRPESSR